MHPLYVSWTQGQTGCRCELRNVALLTFRLSLAQAARFPYPAGGQLSATCSNASHAREGSAKGGHKPAFVKAIHLQAPQQSRRRFRQNLRWWAWWAEGSPSATGLGTARRRETNVSKGTLALPQPTDSDESGKTGLPHREHFCQTSNNRDSVGGCFDPLYTFFFSSNVISASLVNGLKCTLNQTSDVVARLNR
jgi:hypothetical protein